MSWLDRFVLPYVREPMLWPVLIVVIAHVAVFLGPLLVWAVREGRTVAWAALALVGALSGAALRAEWRARGRLAELSAVVGITWLLSAGLAWLADRTGAF